MKADIVQREIRKVQNKTQDKFLIKCLQQLSEEVGYKNHMPIAYLENIVKNSQNDYQLITQLFIDLQTLGYFEKDVQELLWIFIEQYSGQNDIKLFQLLSLLDLELNFLKPEQTYRVLRLIQKMINSSNKVLSVSAQSFQEQKLMQLGQTGKYMLVGDKIKICETEIYNFIIHFSNFFDQKDSYYDAVDSLRILNIIFQQFKDLLILLDPNMAQLIKQRINMKLNGYCEKMVNEAYLILQTLLSSNIKQFLDLHKYIETYVLQDHHSFQKYKALEILVNVSYAYIELLDSPQSEVFYEFYDKLNHLQPLNEEPMKEISQLTGHLIKFDQVQGQMSTNTYVDKMIQLFNLRLSEGLIKLSTQLPIKFQKALKKQIKHQIKKKSILAVTQLSNLYPILNQEIVHQLIIILLDELINWDQFETIKIVQNIIKFYNYDLDGIWVHYFKFYFKQNQLLFQNIQIQNIQNDLKLFCIQTFNKQIMQQIIIALIIHLQNDDYINYSAQLIVQVVLKNGKNSLSLWNEILQILKQKFQESGKKQNLELIFQLLNLRYEHTQQIDFLIIDELIYQDLSIQEIYLSNIITMNRRHKYKDVDMLINIVSKCNPCELVLQAFYEIIQQRDLQEHQIDTILTNFIEKQYEKQEKYMEQIIQRMYQFITDKQYQNILVTLCIKYNLNIKLFFQVVEKVDNQWEFIVQQMEQTDKVLFLEELFKFTIQQNSLELINSQCQTLYSNILLNQPVIIQICTQMAKQYIQLFPQCQLSLLIEAYDKLYSQSNQDDHQNQQITLVLCNILEDLIEIIKILFMHENQLITQVFNLYYKLLLLPLYTDFEEVISKNNLKIDTLTHIIVFQNIIERLNNDQSILEPFLVFSKKLLLLQQNNQLKSNLVEESLLYMKKITNPQFHRSLKGLFIKADIEMQRNLLNLFIEDIIELIQQRSYGQSVIQFSNDERMIKMVKG
ncbi:hypothetical protein pb186bvf_006295 [Paramecium bursaria]